MQGNFFEFAYKNASNVQYVIASVGQESLTKNKNADLEVDNRYFPNFVAI